MFTTDEDKLLFYKQEDIGTVNALYGWVFFVYGNDGYDVVNDYTINLESVMKEANELADKYA